MRNAGLEEAQAGIKIAGRNINNLIYAEPYGRKRGTKKPLDESGRTGQDRVAQSCLTLCDPMDCSLTGSSIHGIFQARILEWVAISFSRRSSQPRDWTWVSHIVGRCFTTWATRIAVKFGGGEFTRVNADIGVLSLCWFILGIWGSLGVRSACLMTSLCSVQLLDP